MSADQQPNIRALVLQTAETLINVDILPFLKEGEDVNGLDWVQIGTVSAVAGVVSVLTSLGSARKDGNPSAINAETTSS
ncbi:holin [Vibrio vulnificus]|uniref:holin n=1 Tax=Vibrio vulnificus TaxID=672 RepID=UPI0010327AF6